VSYIYNKLDPSKNRSLYMYSPYLGKILFKYFKNSRKVNLNKKDLIKYQPNFKLNKEKLTIFFKDFEIKRKIFLKKKEISLNSYIEVSNFASNKLKKKFDLRNFNTLLKLNDYIIYLLKFNKKYNQNILRIFKNEKSLLQKFLKIQGINDKIKL